MLYWLISELRPQQDSNLRSRLRRALIKMALTSAGAHRGQAQGG